MSDLALDYVSPLPPVRTGIADYSLDLMPHLEPLCDLRVVRVPGQPVEKSVRERWMPVPANRLGEPGRTALYHMGNNHLHLEIARLAMSIPGVLVLHDLVLHHFLLGQTVGEDDKHAYFRRINLEHGWVGVDAAHAVRWGAFGDSLQFAFAAHRSLLRRQRGVVVHSEWARGTLLEEEPDLAVRVVPMGIPLPERVSPERGGAFRASLGIPEEAPLLGAFGFQTPMKRPKVAIEALARPELANVHLVIGGEVAPTLELEQVVEEAGLSDRVHITGFLDYPTFEAAIAACDLCLNLRYPTAGETSAALLRVLALGRPTLVSDHAQFADLPSEAAIRIPLGEDEVESLVTEVTRLLSEPGRLVSMGEAARAYIQHEHAPRDAARALVEACRELGPLDPPPPRELEVPAPTSMAYRRLSGRLEVTGHEAPWPEGERRTLNVRLTNTGVATWLKGGRGAGGVVLQLVLLAGDEDLLVDQPWPALSFDLAPGESEEFQIPVRRPLGPAWLRIEPHVLGASGFNVLGGPTWESEI
jgi:glycosyltransferase involved in cell wall biosynthesis